MDQKHTLPKGLSQDEAKRRLRHYGPNEVAPRHTMHGLMDFLLMFKNPLIFILLLAALISATFGDVVSSGIIVGIVVVSIALDFFNTYKSQKAAEALKEQVRTTVKVIRDGHQIEVPLLAVVPGDIVVLSPGDIVPADGDVIEARDLFIDESSLTGESLPAEKQEAEPIFMGSSIVTGRALMKVGLTGSMTKFGAIAQSLAAQEQPTEFERGLRDFSILIIRITFVLVLVILAINTFNGHTIVTSLLFATALAVGLTPELLPMIIAINLSRGSLAMARHGVIVKKLSAIQNFGNMDVLCTDKTGTLTKDKITLVKCVDPIGAGSDDVLLYAYISSSYHSGALNPLDSAVKEFKKLDIASYQKLDEIPFDYKRKRDTIAVEHKGKHILITKGAPEEIFTICATSGPRLATITKDILDQAHAEYIKLSQDGFRVLAVAVKELADTKVAYTKQDEQTMNLVGFVAFFDPPKASATETLTMLEHYGVAIKIITGDNEHVSQKIARDIHLALAGTLLGFDLERMSDEVLREKVEQTTLFARVSPDQKTRIIRALQANGHVVGYLGDGINDAPSLKAADVGVSVNNAVDVAKESADFILINKSLRDLINGVVEGRRVFMNTMKYLMMTLGSNFGNMFSMAGASLVLPFLPMLPVQILLNNLIYDTSQLALPTDNVDPEDLKKPRRFNVAFLKKFMLIFGPISSLFDVATFLVLLYGFNLAGATFQAGWFLESVITQTLVIYIVRTRRSPFWESKPSRYLIMSTVIAIAVSLAIVESSLGGLFGFAPLPVRAVLAMVIITALYLVVVARAKRWLFKTAVAA